MEYILAKRLTVKLFNFILGLFLTLILLSTSKKRVKRSRAALHSKTATLRGPQFAHPCYKQLACSAGITGKATFQLKILIQLPGQVLP